MSFVGPRPIIQPHLDLYPERIRKEILKLTPGLTGIGSLVFRDEEGILDRAGGDMKRLHDTVIAPYKAELELWFTKHRGITLYFFIILLTGLSIFRPKSDVYKRIFRDMPPAPAEIRPYI